MVSNFNVLMSPGFDGNMTESPNLLCWGVEERQLEERQFQFSLVDVTLSFFQNVTSYPFCGGQEDTVNQNLCPPLE